MPPTPAGIWEYGKNCGLHYLKTVEDPKLLRIVLFDKHPVSISRKGILANVGEGLSVTCFCKKLDELGAFEPESKITVTQ